MSEPAFERTMGSDASRVVMDDDPRLLARRYQWLLQLMRDDDTGSLRTFVQQARKELKRSKGNLDLFRAWWNENWSKTDWYKSRDSFRRESEIQRSDPTTREDYLRSLERTRTRIQNLADRYGIRLTPQEVNNFAEESRLMQWTDSEIDQKLRPLLETQVAGAEQGFTRGAAGDIENSLLNWSKSNGLTLSRQMLARYVSDITTGKQSLENAQQELRRTYLAGMYPAWADKINAGFDPSDLFEPYRNSAASLLEMDDITLDDPILKRATQHVGADGKPSQLPMYEFEKQIRQDPRWQKTNNAHESYARMAQDVLRMFGFR